MQAPALSRESEIDKEAPGGVHGSVVGVSSVLGSCLAICSPHNRAFSGCMEGRAGHGVGSEKAHTHMGDNWPWGICLTASSVAPGRLKQLYWA